MLQGAKEGFVEAGLILEDQAEEQRHVTRNIILRGF